MSDTDNRLAAEIELLRRDILDVRDQLGIPPYDAGEGAGDAGEPNGDPKKWVTVAVDPDIRRRVLDAAAVAGLGYREWCRRWILAIAAEAAEGAELPRTRLNRRGKVKLSSAERLDFNLTAAEDDAVRAAASRAGIKKATWCRDALVHALHRAVAGGPVPPV